MIIKKNDNNNNGNFIQPLTVLLLIIDCVVGLSSFVPAERRLYLGGGLVQLRIGQVDVQQLWVQVLCTQ